MGESRGDPGTPQHARKFKLNGKCSKYLFFVLPIIYGINVHLLIFDQLKTIVERYTRVTLKN